MLNHLQARFTQRLYARPRDGSRPEEILTRECSDLTTRLRAAAVLGRRKAVEAQERGTGRQFSGKVIIDSKAGALQTASEWRQQDTLWTDSSRVESGEVGAACFWQSPSDWTGRRFYPVKNKEVFDAETFATYQALRVLDRRQESGHRYRVFVDSTVAVEYPGLTLWVQASASPSQ